MLHGLLLLAATLAAPDLGVSPSGHYITYGDRTLMLFGDSGTQCVTQNANLDYRAWIDDCHDRGIPLVHIWAFMPARQTQDGSVMEDRWGYVYPCIMPWPRKPDGPPAQDQLPQWDLQAFDDGPEDALDRYWPRMRDLCRYAKDKGMVVGVTIFTGWAKYNEDFAYHPFHVNNGGFLKDVKDVVDLATTGQEVCQDAWDDSWPPAKKNQWAWERLSLEYINQLNGFGNVFFVFLDEHSYPEGDLGKHFLPFFQKRGAVWVDWDARRNEVDWVYSDTVAGSDKNNLAVKGFNGDPVRPYLLLEGPPYNGPGAREAMWTFAMGGGHYTFHADAEQDTPRTGIMGYDPHVPNGNKGMDKRDWLGIASRFFNGILTNLDSMIPHNNLVSEGAYCFADPGRLYAVYLKSGEADTCTVNLSAMGGKAVHWRMYNPRTGEWGAWAQHAGDTLTVKKPDPEDWAVCISADRP